MDGPEDFVPFQSIPRLARGCVVTEKIDGTNACVLVTPDGRVVAGSRTKWITPADDNHGFAAWVEEHAAELRELGEGRHFGEWWGHKIQRGYGMPERRFSLFNVARWGEARPACCHVVPMLHRGTFDTVEIEIVLNDLARYGSRAAPGFMEPEGVVVFHEASGRLYKKTLGNDGHKGAA